MLKIIGSSYKLASSRNNDNKPAFTRNNSSKPTFRKNNSNNKDKFGNNSVKHIKKSEKSKDQKIIKFWNSAKSRKKLSKSRNLSNFGIIKTRSKFLTFDTKTAFNCL